MFRRVNLQLSVSTPQPAGVICCLIPPTLLYDNNQRLPSLLRTDYTLYM